MPKASLPFVPNHLPVVLCVAIAGSAGLCGQTRVVLISVDGLRPDALTAETAPHMAALRAAGTRAAVAWNDLPAATLPNHTTMLTGIIVGRHGVVLDFDLPGRVSEPTVFDYASAAGLRCAFFVSKSKLLYLAHAEALETILFEPEQALLAERVVEQITPAGPDLIFVHFRDPDSTGHRSGWMSAPYLEAVAFVDGLIGRIVAASDADTSRGTYLLLTADHGGEGPGHILNTPAVRQIPWIVAGPDVPPGGVLDEIVATADTTPTVLWLLGVEVPAGLSGVVRSGVKDGGAASSALLPAVPPVSLPCVILFVPAFFVVGLVACRAVLSAHACR